MGGDGYPQVGWHRRNRGPAERPGCGGCSRPETGSDQDGHDEQSDPRRSQGRHPQRARGSNQPRPNAHVLEVYGRRYTMLMAHAHSRPARPGPILRNVGKGLAKASAAGDECFPRCAAGSPWGWPSGVLEERRPAPPARPTVEGETEGRVRVSCQRTSRREGPRGRGAGPSRRPPDNPSREGNPPPSGSRSMTRDADGVLPD